MCKPHKDSFFGIDYEINTCVVCVGLNQFEERDLNMPLPMFNTSYFLPARLSPFIHAPHPQFTSAARVCGFAKVAVYMTRLYV